MAANMKITTIMELKLKTGQEMVFDVQEFSVMEQGFLFVSVREIINNGKNVFGYTLEQNWFKFEDIDTFNVKKTIFVNGRESVYAEKQRIGIK